MNLARACSWSRAPGRAPLLRCLQPSSPTQRPLSNVPRAIRKVGVVGLGLMGHGVAQVCAQANYQVVAIELQKPFLDSGMKRIETSLSKVIGKDVQKGKYKSEEEGKKVYDTIMKNIIPTTSLADAKDCDLIIEAIAENMDLKLNFYKNLGPIINKDCIFASNTSSLQITAMALASGRADKFVGLHFFNPVQIMKLVEVIRCDATSNNAFDSVLAFGKSINKQTVSCRDTPGFIVNRLLVPYLTQALAMYDRKEATIQDIDISMQLGAGHPMGPLHLSDYIGLDTMYNILVGWKKDYPHEAAFIIPKCLEDKVKEGNLGRKTGKGFYVWNGDKAVSPIEQ